MVGSIGSPSFSGPSRPLPYVASRHMLVAVLAASVLIGGCSRGQDTRAIQTGSSAESETAAPAKLTSAAVGQPVNEPPLRVTVVSAGPARLDPKAPPPAAGARHVEVRVTLENTGSDPLPINASPYSPYNTQLEVQGVRYDGALVAGFVNQVRSGAIPPATPLNLRFVFEVPQATEAGTFMWPPGSAGPSRPVIAVALDGLGKR